LVRTRVTGSVLAKVEILKVFTLDSFEPMTKQIWLVLNVVGWKIDEVDIETDEID